MICLRNAILSLSIILLASSGFAQKKSLGSNFFKNSCVGLGLDFSQMVNDDIFNQDLARFSGGYFFEVNFSGNFGLESGLVYKSRGGKSFNEDVYQSFNYLSVPAKLSYTLFDNLSLKAGVSQSVLLSYATRKRGLRTLIDPNPYDYEPRTLATSLLAEIELGLGKFFKTSITGNYAFNSSGVENSKLSFISLGMMFKVNIGEIVERSKQLSTDVMERNDRFLKLKSGYVIVVLGEQKSKITYYTNKGDSDNVKLVRRDRMFKNRSLKAAFKEEFQYSSVLFLKVSDQYQFLQGNREGITLENRAGEIIKAETITTQNYVLFKPGDIYGPSPKVRRGGYYFIDPSGERLGDPYPSLDMIGFQDLSNLKVISRRLNARMYDREKAILDRRNQRLEIQNK